MENKQKATSQIAVLNYATSEVDIITGIPDGMEAKYFNEHYKESECYYMASNIITTRIINYDNSEELHRCSERE